MRDPHAPRFFYTPRLVTPRNNLSRCTWDSYPLSPGHTLIIFGLRPGAMATRKELLVAEERDLQGDLKPDGYTSG